MKKLLIAFLLCVAAMSSATAQESKTFWLGADISGTTELEARGVRLYNKAGEIRENTALMHELGLNAVRLRVWVNPRGGFSSMPSWRFLKHARRARNGKTRPLLRYGYND